LLASVISGIPSCSFCLYGGTSISDGATDALDSLAAVGNAVLAEDSPRSAMMLAGIVLHYLLCFLLSIALHLELSTEFLVRALAGSTWKKHGRHGFMLFALAVSFCAHVFNLIVLPSVWNMPLLDALLLRTGHVPHICDHAAFGATAAFVLTSTSGHNSPAKQRR
jgi:hypothetical protein